MTPPANPAPGSAPSAASGREHAARAAALVKERFAAAVRGHATFREEETLLIDAASVVEIARFLKTDPAMAFTALCDLTASHWLDREHEYEVAWLFRSMPNNSVIRLKARVGGSLGAGEVPTLTGVYAAADWLEREEWDKVGVVFAGHPNLKRILMPEDWEGHPLRKDYPVEGIGA